MSVIPPSRIPSLHEVETWLVNSAVKVGGAFLTAFLGAVIAAGAGVTSLATLKAAAVGALAAGISALDSVLGNLVHPSAHSIVGALRARNREAQAAKADAA